MDDLKTAHAWTEYVARIYSGDSTEYAEVGPDADGLGLVEVVLRESSGDRLAEMRFRPEMARMVGAALTEIASQVDRDGDDGEADG